jgi:hypothetical protein
MHQTSWLFVAALISILVNTLATKLKRIGEIGPSCLTPRLVMKKITISIIYSISHRTIIQESFNHINPSRAKTPFYHHFDQEIPITLS